MSRNLRTPLLTVLAAAPLVVGCSSSAGGDDRDGDRVRAEGGAFSLEMPEGWSRMDDAPSTVALALQKDDNDHSQVLAVAYDDPAEAEKEALWMATGFASSQGIACEREEKSDVFAPAELFFDCPWTEPEPFHKILVPVVDDDRSVMFLLQADGAELDDVVAEVGPVIDTFAWE